ncbi:response regulator [Cryptosporangium sp. NPDC051539]|uniref:response regulator transcription factor n=1 Tax=Cryptosporangium sp. NPDC051539 TaxID=3363962 RepID=UPI0037BC8C8D
MRVLVADDDALARTGLRMVMSSDPELDLVAEAVDGTEAVAGARRVRPDVILMDLRMPELDGVRATRRITSQDGAPAVLILTAFHVDAYVLDALEAGARGYLLKETAPRELIRAIHVVAGGGSVFSAPITERLVHQLRRRGDDDVAQRAAQRLAALTERERAVAEAVADGLSNAAIAATLLLGEATVKTHVSRILTKTGSANRVQIALLVYQART